jgi:hypothetical protein
MDEEIIDRDIARNSTPSYHDIARHSLTIAQAIELFVQLGVPRSKRSVQRFCEHGHLDCVRIKGERGDQFFINRESVERYAEELRQIKDVAAIGVEPRHGALQRAIARNSAPERDSIHEQPKPTEPLPSGPPEEAVAEIKRLRDETLNLRIDNRAKEQAINFLMTQASTKDQQLQDLSYRLGASETRLAQLDAPKGDDEAPRQTAPEPAIERVEAIIIPASTSTESTPPVPDPEPPQPEPGRSFLSRLFG